jgi:hypothetical protein
VSTAPGITPETGPPPGPPGPDLLTFLIGLGALGGVLLLLFGLPLTGGVLLLLSLAGWFARPRR